MTQTETNGRRGRPLASLSVCLAALAAAATVGIAALAGATASGAPSDLAAGGKSQRPNVVVLMTDDQTVADMRVLPKVKRLLTDKGTTFVNNYVTNPICCPSRSTFFSGQYAHNNGVLRNSVPDGGFETFDGTETLPVWLDRAGYTTGHVGKYLNGYGFPDQTEIPPGWNEWFGSTDPGTYRMYGYTLNENGTPVTYGDYDTPDPANYQTDVYASKAVDFIRRNATSPTPFFLSLAPLAPHTEVFKRPSPGEDDPPTPSYPNPRPAPRYADAFANERLPTGASFNEADISDKPVEIRSKPRLTAFGISKARHRYRSRLASLLAIDDMAQRIVGALRKSGELDNTVIVFTSDNGYLLGEHRIPQGKEYPYEESIRVPLVIRGPGIPRGEVRRQPAVNADLAPTILDLTGAEAGGPIDGRSLVPLIDDRRDYPGRAIVLENWCQVDEGACYDPANPEIPRYRGVRTDRYAYMRYPNGEQEMYDLERDPEELKSLQRSPRYRPQLAALSKLLDRLQFCRQAGCRIAPKLKLKLAYRPGKLAGGGSCTNSAVRVRIGGRNGGQAVSAKFLLPNGRDAADSHRPLRARVPESRLNRKRRAPIAAQVSVLDGRIKSVAGRVPRAC